MMSRFETMTETIHEENSTSLNSPQRSTLTLTSENNVNTDPATVRLRLTRRLSHNAQKQQTTSAGLTRRRVSWTTDTVDNEFLNKKKSKCCCIYQKPRNWDESSSDDENEDHDCQNCRGHRKSDFNKNKTKDNERQEQVCNDLESININSTQICETNSNNSNINKMETNESK